MKTFSIFKISGYLIAGLFFFLLSTSLHAARYDDVYIRISPKSVIVGEPAELSLISAAGFPEIDKLPSVPGLTWSSAGPNRSTSTSIIQARRISTFSTRYQFTVSKEGTLKIPALKVKIGHQIKTLRAKEFKAYKRKVVDSTGKEISLDSLLYSSALLKTSRDFVYVGEEIPLEIHMYSVNGLPITRSWPQIDMENVVMKDYSSVNPQSSYFQPPKLKTIREKGETFDECIFKAALRPISPGTLSGKVIIPCLIKIPREGASRGRRRNDPLSEFFSNGFFDSRYRNLKYKLQADIAPKKVISLPDAPKDSYYTGLVGEWDLQYYLTSNKLKAGEPVTLKIILKGKGTLDTLSAPEITIEGFRIYPPEIKKEPDSGRISKGEIQYAIIPKSAGDTKIDIAFSTFSPLRKKYIVKRFSREFTIAKGDDVSNGVVDDTAAAYVNEENANSVSAKKERNGLYLKTERSGSVQIPLRKNKLFWIVLMFILGPLVLILSELISFQKQKLSNDPMLRRKNSARKRKRAIINSIYEAESEDKLHEIIQNDLTPMINDLYGYPPGTSTDELAEKVGDPKLSSCLKAGSSSSYMPGNSGEFSPKNLKKHLLKALQKLSIIILIGCCTSLYAAKNTATIDENDPVAAYDRNDAKTAEKIYKSQLDPKNPDPAWIYNIGNCAMQEGNLAKALVYYERARRLDPADSDIRENLNFVRRKLLLPEIGNSNTPIDLLENFRDSLRPDAWMLIIAVTWSMCWLSLALRRRLSNRKWASALVISLILLTLSILAYTSQQHCTYNSRDAIVVKRGVPVYMLPSVKSGSAGFKLRAGEEISIEEERHQWLRIRQDHSEGWVQADSVKRLWPY